MTTIDVNELVIGIRAELDKKGFIQAQNAGKEFSRAFKKGDLDKFSTKQITQGLKIMESPIIAAQKQTKEFTDKLKNLKAGLMSVGFAFLFTGMMVNRYTMNIIKSSLKTFSTITYGAEGAGGAIGVLSVHWELLKFAIGDALNVLLEAYMPAIINVIVWIVNLIEKHKTLVATILIVTAIVSGLAMVIGAGSLFAIAMVDMVKWLGLAKTGMSNLGIVFNVLKKAVGLGLLIHVGLRMLGRDYVPGGGAILGDAIEAALGGYWIGGIKGAVIGLAISVVFNTVALEYGLTGAELKILAFQKVVLMLQHVWDRVALSAENAGRIMSAVHDKNITLKEASLENMKQQAILNEKIAKENAENEEVWQKALGVGEARNMIKALAESGVDISKGFYDVGTAFSQEDMLKFGSIAKILEKTSEDLWKEATQMVQASAQAWDNYKTSSQSLSEQIQGDTIPSNQKLKETTDETSETIQTMNINLGTANERINNFVNTLTQAGMDTQKALAIATKAIIDPTNAWYDSVMQKQQSLGIETTGAHTYSGINYATAKIGEDIMTKYFGDYTAGVGQNIPGMLSQRALGAGVQPSSVFQKIDRSTIIHNQTNVSDGTTTSQGGRYY